MDHPNSITFEVFPDVAAPFSQGLVSRQSLREEQLSVALEAAGHRCASSRGLGEVPTASSTGRKMVSFIKFKGWVEGHSLRSH